MQGLIPIICEISEEVIAQRIRKYKRFHPRKTKIANWQLRCMVINSINAR